jgi:hypothetical protein
MGARVFWDLKSGFIAAFSFGNLLHEVKLNRVFVYTGMMYDFKFYMMVSRVITILVR